MRDLIYGLLGLFQELGDSALVVNCTIAVRKRWLSHSCATSVGGVASDCTDRCYRAFKLTLQTVLHTRRKMRVDIMGDAERLLVLQPLQLAISSAVTLTYNDVNSSEQYGPSEVDMQSKITRLQEQKHPRLG